MKKQFKAYIARILFSLAVLVIGCVVNDELVGTVLLILVISAFISHIINSNKEENI